MKLRIKLTAFLKRLLISSKRKIMVMVPGNSVLYTREDLLKNESVTLQE